MSNSLLGFLERWRKGLGSFLCSLQVSPNFNCKLLETLEVLQFFIFFKQFVSCIQEALIQCCCMLKTLGKILDSVLIQSKCEPSGIQVAK